MKALVALAGVWLITAGVYVGLTSPLLSGGHLIGGPVLILAGGGLLARVAQHHEEHP